MSRLARACALLFLAGCGADAILDLSLEPRGGGAVGWVDVVVCSARDRSNVLERATLTPSTSTVLRLPADGRAVGVAARSADGLCGATCQVLLEPGATVRGTLVLVPCAPCLDVPITAEAVCRDPLCFVADDALSLCE